MTDAEVTKLVDWMDEHLDDESIAQGLIAADNKEQYIKDHIQQLRSEPGWASVEPNLSTMSVLDEVAKEYRNIEDIPEAYLASKADEVGIDFDKAKSYVNKRINKRSDRTSEKQQLADEYKRSRETFHLPGFLENEYSKAARLKGDTPAQVGHEVASDIAFLSDFAPFPVSLAGPIIRSGQQFAYGGPSEWWKNKGTNLLDIGSTLLGPAKGAAKGAAAIGYEGIKALAGPFGRLFNSGVAKSIEKAAKEADKTKLAEEFTKKVDPDYINKLLQDFFDGKISDKDALAYAASIKDIAPTYAEEITNYVLDKSKNWPKFEKTNIDGKLTNHTHGYTIDKSKVGLTNEIFDDKGNLKPLYVLRQVVDKKGNIDTKPVNVVKDPSVISTQQLRDIATYEPPTKFGKFGLSVVERSAKPSLKFATQVYSDKADVKAPTQQDYDKAVDYVIEDYKRMWDAGFVPHNDGSIVYEAYQKYLKDKDND